MCFNQQSSSIVDKAVHICVSTALRDVPMKLFIFNSCLIFLKNLCVASHKYFRNGKQHAGITNCQSTDFRKLDFHFNASLAAINLAKAACKRLGIAYSISSCKSFIHNAYMLERFICVFGINPDPQVIDKLFKELILFTARAA
jgi:hypothetical protein